MSIGHSPSESSWKPDMRKDEKDVTEADKKDAQRRIQGGFSASSPGDSPREASPTI
jgi:phosphatidylserine decarboxylase